MAGRKKSTEDVKEAINSLPSGEITEEEVKTKTPKKTSSKKKQVEEDDAEELIIDGKPYEEKMEEEMQEDAAEDSSSDEEFTEEENEQISNAVNQLTTMLTQIYGSKKRKMKHASREFIQQMAQGNKTADAFYLSDEEKVKNEVDFFKEESQELSLACNNEKKELKTVHIYGAEKDENLSWCAVGYLKSRGGKNAQYKIKIPASELTVFTQTDLEGLGLESNKDMLEAIHQIVSRWVGTDIQVTIKRVYAERKEAFASRLEASEKLARNFFRRNAKGSNKPRYGIGDKVSAQIVEVKRDRVKVSIYGQDTWIKSNEVAWAITGKVSDLFKAGQRVNVLITNIIPDWLHENKVYDIKYHLSLIEASIKQASPNPIIEKFEKKYQIDGEYEANYLYSLKSGRIMCLTDDMVNIVGTPAAVGKIGKVVKIRIVGKDPKTYQIWGDIVNPNVR